MIKSSARVKSSKILEVHSDKPLWNKSQKRHGDHWWFTTNTNTWAAFTPVESNAIEKAYQEGKTELRIRKGMYSIDFHNMVQTNTATGRVRDIARNKS